MYRLGRMVGGTRIGVAAAWIFALLVANPVVVRDANTETFALLPVVLGLVLWARAMAGDGQTGKRANGQLGGRAGRQLFAAAPNADPHPSPLPKGEGTGSLWLFVVAGVCFAVAVATKTTFGFPVVMLAFFA